MLIYVGQRGSFGADTLFDDLDKHFVAAAEDVLDRRLDSRSHAGAHLTRCRAGAATLATLAVAFAAITIVAGHVLCAIGLNGFVGDRSRLGGNTATRRR